MNIPPQRKLYGNENKKKFTAAEDLYKIHEIYRAWVKGRMKKKRLTRNEEKDRRRGESRRRRKKMEKF